MPENLSFRPTVNEQGQLNRGPNGRKSRNFMGRSAPIFSAIGVAIGETTTPATSPAVSPITSGETVRAPTVCWNTTLS